MYYGIDRYKPKVQGWKINTSAMLTRANEDEPILEKENIVSSSFI